MCWILEMRIKEEESEHWALMIYEYNSKEKAEAAGVAAKLCGLCKYYNIYHS